MVWVTPRTWSAGETVTAALMNAHVRDELNALASKGIVIGFGSISGGVIGTGVHYYISVPASVKITGWVLLADASGSMVIDVWKDTYGNFPPTVADTIAGSEKPTLTTQQRNEDLTLTTWTQNVDAGDVLAFKVDSCTTIKAAVLTLLCEPR